VWKLLAMYLVVMNRRALQKHQGALNLSRLIGGIVARHVLANAEWIQREYHEVKLELLREGVIARFYSSEQLEAIEGADAAELPSLLAIDWRARHGRPRAEDRAFREPHQRSARDVLRAARQARKL
jgi:hypothetical protein